MERRTAAQNPQQTMIKQSFKVTLAKVSIVDRTFARTLVEMMIPRKMASPAASKRSVVSFAFSDGG
ncbi:hypothetical protein V5E97_16930 [Singulisphaera sp. Ch08]|uniref:Uncharacterized protein n=1 Tax=Singulisphaera sp. Ch08 TaxID=3120278 RepID=A0AAU7CRZ5_9BACT